MESHSTHTVFSQPVPNPPVEPYSWTPRFERHCPKGRRYNLEPFVSACYSYNVFLYCQWLFSVCSCIKYQVGSDASTHGLLPHDC
jgi:hypothetical protein